MSSQTRSRICISIGGRTAGECLKALKGQEFAEIRLDMLERATGQDVKRLFAGKLKLIATCRPGKLADGWRKELLLEAIDTGAAYVDVEVEAGDGYKKEIVAAAKAKGCAAIVSFHDHDKTPGEGELKQIVDWCFESGADIAKIACKVNTDGDNARLLGLLDDRREIIVVGMGTKGRITRIAAPLLGSPFTFASAAAGKETAEGQIDGRTLDAILRTLEEYR